MYFLLSCSTVIPLSLSPSTGKWKQGEFSQSFWSLGAMSSSSSERILRNGCGGGDLSAATAEESNSASPEVYMFVKMVKV